jgi:hypothetical protein
MLNFNEANEQRSFDVIPDGSIAVVHMTIRNGGAGDGGWLRRSKDGNSEGLDCEFTVASGPFAKRKFWSLFTISGTTPGHAQAAEISGTKLRAILESARGVRPDDKSDTAQQARRVASYGDFDGIRFIARIGVEPPQNGYEAKNTLDQIITPDRTDWYAVEHVAKPGSAPTTPTAPTAGKAEPAKIVKPSWAK